MPFATFVETPVFTALVHQHLSEAAYHALQLSLLLRPEQGALIPGAGGLRKVRWSGRGIGKRGGVRVIYYWQPRASTCYMLYIYAKNRQGDLSTAQAKELARLVRKELR